MSRALAQSPKAVSGLMARGGGDTTPSEVSPPIVQLVLPAPPSANALFKNVPGKGRVRTPMYDTWLAHAGWRLRAQHPGLVKGPVLIVMGVERTNALSDLDNRTKALWDLLVKHQVIEDDRFVIGQASAWNPARDGLVRVAIVPAADLCLRFILTDARHGGFFIEPPDADTPLPTSPSTGRGGSEVAARITEGAI